MPFYFVHADKKLLLEDLPLDRWIAIQDKSGCPWPEILTGKVVGDAKVIQAVVTEAAAFLGIDPPTLTLRGAVDSIVFETEDTLPTEYADGIPDPKAQASEAETT